MKQQFSIALKLSVLVVAFVTITAFALSGIYTKGTEEILVNKAVSDLEQEASIFQYPLAGTINQLKEDVRLIRHMPALDGIIRAQVNNGTDPFDGSTEKQWIERLAVIFKQTLLTRKNYTQVRFIGVKDNGKELLRVDRTDGAIYRVLRDKLQQKGDMPYFNETLKLQPEDIYLSDIELNRDFGKITKPYTLVLRASTPVYGPDGKVFGIVVINADFGAMLQATKSYIADNRELYIANAEGSYIFHPDSTKLYAGDLGRDARLQKDFPQFLKIIAQDDKKLSTELPKDKESGKILSYYQYYYDNGDQNHFLLFVLEAPYNEVIKNIKHIQERGLYVNIAITIISALLAVIFLRILVKPLNQIADAVVRYRHGEKHIKLPTESSDEIGLLAQEFQAMIDQKEEEDWVKENLVSISKRILGQKEFDDFAEVLIKNLVSLVEAQLGVIYIHSALLPETGHKKHTLVLTGAYGVQNRDTLPSAFEIGEGIIGQAAEEMQTLLLTDIPETYLDISTALAHGKPRQVIVFPIPYKQSVAGVIEIATIGKFSEIQKEFLEQLSFNIGVIINNMASAAQTQALLEKTQSAAKELAHSNQELDDFAYIASHDLKEPLRGLFNNSKFLLEDYGDKIDDDGKEMLERMGYLSQRMEALINDLLYFSRLGRQTLAIQNTNLNEVIDDIEDMMADTVKTANVVIEVKGTLPNIICDKPRITELLRNLITNAIKYNNKNEKHIEIGFLNSVHTKEGTENNVFYVKDNGIGIKEEFHHEIFRIFKRLNEEDDTKKGTGVGLTFVKKIVERHGGKIWIESIYGKGTTFFFTLRQQNVTEQKNPANQNNAGDKAA